MDNYNKIIERISIAANVEKEDIERRIEAKRAKLSGLISKEGAAQIIAAELGISFDKQRLKIGEILPGMKRISVVCKVIKIFSVRSFNKGGREGKVANLIVADETGNTRAVLWDTNHIKLLEEKTISEGDVIDISNASVRDAEIHVTGFSDIKKSDEVMENVKVERSFYEKKIVGVKPGEAVRIRGVVVQIFEPRTFEVCPQCNSRANKNGENYTCEKHGSVVPLKRALVSMVLDDGSENIRVVLFNEQMEKLELSVENFQKEKDRILGEEYYFSGSARKNKMFENTEIFVSDIEEVNLDKLIKVLEEKNK